MKQIKVPKHVRINKKGNTSIVSFATRNLFVLHKMLPRGLWNNNANKQKQQLFLLYFTEISYAHKFMLNFFFSFQNNNLAHLQHAKSQRTGQMS